MQTCTCTHTHTFEKLYSVERKYISTNLQRSGIKGDICLHVVYSWHSNCHLSTHTYETVPKKAMILLNQIQSLKDINTHLCKPAKPFFISPQFQALEILA